MRRIETLVITGVLTDAGVESSARHAAERGFQVVSGIEGAARDGGTR